MNQHEQSKRQSPHNWLVIFLTTLVGVWLVQQVVNAATNAFWRIMFESPMLNFTMLHMVDILLRGLLTFGTLVALVVVVSVLRKWAVLWPVPVFYVLNLMFGAAAPFVLASHTPREMMLMSAITVMFYFAAAIFTFILVRRHNKKARASNESEPEQTMLT
ncbi:MAG: hypothetical protein FWE40_08500 [Oscillospiraceae bacterium]|nr:hypothetical protein [Oscillospiraceae bacterium]